MPPKTVLLILYSLLGRHIIFYTSSLKFLSSIPNNQTHRIKKSLIFFNAAVCCFGGMVAIIYSVFQQDLVYIINGVTNGFMILAVGVFSFWTLLSDRINYVLYSYMILFISFFIGSFYNSDPSNFSIVKIFVYLVFTVHLTLFYEFKISVKIFLGLISLLIFRQFVVHLELVDLNIVDNSSLIQLFYFELASVYCFCVAAYYENKISQTNMQLQSVNTALKVQIENFNNSRKMSNELLDKINRLTSKTTLDIRRNIDKNLSLVRNHKNLSDLINESTYIAKDIDKLLKDINEELDINE